MSELAVDTTMGLPSRAMWSPSGAQPPMGRRRKGRTHPELTGEHGRARLVVLGVEVGGRWSADQRVLENWQQLVHERLHGLGGLRAAWLRTWHFLVAQLPGLSAALSWMASGADGAIPSMSTVLSEA